MLCRKAQDAMTDGRCPGGGPGDKASGSSRDPTVHFSQKMPKKTLVVPFKKLQFHEFC